MSEGTAIVIVKKKKGGGGDGHHGGAWKVAYADFVTAMMAFFLLMWLLSSTSEEQRQGIADYFSPRIPISDASSGGASLFGGDSALSASTLASDGTGGSTEDDGSGDGPKEGVAQTAPDPSTVDPFLKAVARARAEMEFEQDQRLAEAAATAEAAQRAAEAAAQAAVEADQALSEALAASLAEGGLETGDARQTVDVERDPDAKPAPEALAEADAPEAPEPTPEDFKVADRAALEKALQDPNLSSSDRDAMRAAFEAIEAADENGELLQHLAMRVTPEGLLIEIAETARTPLFGSGSAAPSPIMTALMEAIAPAIASLTNRVAIVGHTDARPFAVGRRRSNWTLSAERADAARTLLEQAGLAPERLVRISGAADRDPLSEDVYAPENRRIGLTLLREPSKRARSLAPAESGTPDAPTRPNSRDAASDL